MMFNVRIKYPNDENSSQCKQLDSSYILQWNIHIIIIIVVFVLFADNCLYSRSFYFLFLFCALNNKMQMKLYKFDSFGVMLLTRSDQLPINTENFSAYSYCSLDSNITHQYVWLQLTKSICFYLKFARALCTKDAIVQLSQNALACEMRYVSNQK